MRQLLLICLLLASYPAVAGDGPSRKADKGCTWGRLSDQALGLAVWAQNCDFGFRKIKLYFAGNSLVEHYSDGGEPDSVIDVLNLNPGEKPAAGIRRIFAEHTDAKLAPRCRLVVYRQGKTPPGVKRYTFVPNAAFQKELDAHPSDGVPDPPCGDWGDAPDGIQYFEAQPASGAQKVLFVRVGQDQPLFDEATLKLLPAP